MRWWKTTLTGAVRQGAVERRGSGFSRVRRDSYTERFAMSHNLHVTIILVLLPLAFFWLWSFPNVPGLVAAIAILAVSIFLYYLLRRKYPWVDAARDNPPTAKVKAPS